MAQPMHHAVSWPTTSGREEISSTVLTLTDDEFPGPVPFRQSLEVWIPFDTQIPPVLAGTVARYELMKRRRTVMNPSTSPVTQPMAASMD